MDASLVHSAVCQSVKLSVVDKDKLTHTITITINLFWYTNTVFHCLTTILIPTNLALVLVHPAIRQSGKLSVVDLTFVTLFI